MTELQSLKGTPKGDLREKIADILTPYTHATIEEMEFTQRIKIDYEIMDKFEKLVEHERKDAFEEGKESVLKVIKVWENTKKGKQVKGRCLNKSWGMKS